VIGEFATIHNICTYVFLMTSLTGFIPVGAFSLEDARDVPMLTGSVQLETLLSLPWDTYSSFVLARTQISPARYIAIWSSVRRFRSYGEALLIFLPQDNLVGLGVASEYGPVYIGGNLIDTMIVSYPCSWGRSSCCIQAQHKERPLARGFPGQTCYQV
jgi:hypothetical protein